MSLSRPKCALLLSYISLAAVSASMLTPAFPAIKNAYGLSQHALNMLVGLFLVGYVAGQLIYGPLASRFGRLTALRGGLVVNACGLALSLLSIYAHHYPLLLFSRLVTALGAASGLCCTFILINELFPKEKASQVSAYAVLSFTLGHGLAVLFGGFITEYLGWPSCFWLLLAHGLILFVCTFMFEETLTEPVPFNLYAVIRGYLHVLSHLQFITFSLSVGIVSTIAYGYSLAAPIFAAHTLALSPSEYGMWNGINTIGMLCGGLLSAQLLKHLKETTVLYIGLVLLAPIIGALYLFDFLDGQHPLLFFLLTTQLFLYSGALFPTGSFLAIHSVADRASASSMMSFINMATSTTAVLIMGYLHTSELTAFLAVLSGFYCLNVVLLLRINKNNCYANTQ